MVQYTDNPADELKPAANVTLNSEDQHKKSSNKSRCMKFFSTSGCPYGEQCHFQHFVLQGSLAGTIASLPALAGGAKKRALLLNLLDPSLHVRGFKTKLCHNYSTSHGCKYGEHCHYAHTNAELRSKTSSAAYYTGRNFKLSSSNPRARNEFSAYQYPLVSTCTWSSSNKSTCGLPFAPMDNLTSSLYYGEPTPPGVSCDHAFNYKEGLIICEGTPISSTYATISSPNSVLMQKCNEGDNITHKESLKVTSMPIDAAMAGFIIGREGGNVRQLSKLTGSRLSIREHSEGDCKLRIIHMEGLPHQVDDALQMIKLLIKAKEAPSK